MRLVAAAVMLAGCDGVLGLGDIHVPPDAQYFDAAPDSAIPPCSHFTTIEAVAFASPIVALSSLSVRPDDTDAVVFGRPDVGTLPRVMSLQRTTATGAWGLATQGGPASTVTPQIAAPGDLFVGTLLAGSTHYSLGELTYASGSWHAATRRAPQRGWSRCSRR